LSGAESLLSPGTRLPDTIFSLMECLTFPFHFSIIKKVIHIA
jgi:hypothetical protein